VKLSIVIASHGSDKWCDLAWSRAYPSAEAQGAHEVLIEHDSDQSATRAEVRNRLIERATGDWICTLDADDELAPGFVDAMRDAWSEPTYQGMLYPDTVLFVPRVQYVHRRIEEPRFPPEVDLRKGNWMVVGTVVPRLLVLEVGGWRVFTGSGVLNQWDDWDLWIRCGMAGAVYRKTPKAIYVAHAVPGSPQRHVSPATRRFWLSEIRHANWPEEYAAPRMKIAIKGAE
jgi:glycosyltransferase involved in cell wall biosynthesis